MFPSKPAKELWFSVVFFILWTIAEFVAVESPEYVTCSICAILFAAWQLALLTFLSYRNIVPNDRELLKDGAICTLERVARVHRHVVELKIKVPRDEFDLHTWTEQIARSGLRSSEKVWGGLDVQQTATMLPIDVCEARLEDGDFKATLTFEPVRCMSRIMMFSFSTPRGKGGNVEFVLPRFLWICCRDDAHLNRQGVTPPDDEEVEFGFRRR